MAKRILHVSGRMAIGGAERAIYQLIASQMRKGDVPDLLTTSAIGYYSQEVGKLGAKVHEFKQGHLFGFAGISRFLKLAKEYDIIHFHAPSPALMLACLILPDNKKLFYTHRAGKHIYPLRRRLAYRTAGYCIRRKFTSISGNTNFAARTAAELFDLDAKTITTTYNGIDFDLLLPKSERREVLAELGDQPSDKIVRIGTTGNLRKWKRVDYLLNAIAEVRSEKVVCYVVGGGSETPVLQSLAEKIGITELVRFPGKKDHIGDYLQILDIFVLPSDQGESFGNSAVEAMGLGIPTIVMRDGGGLVEHVPEGCGFIADNHDHLVEILVELIMSVNLRRKIGAAGRDYVRSKYTYENMIKGYEKLYETKGM